MRVTLKEAKEFHGHLGPYLILGIVAGELALKKLKAKKYFGLEVKVWGANHKPRSCLIDGLQLATGATYGKGNIQKLDGKEIEVLLKNIRANKRIKISLKKDLIHELSHLRDKRSCEDFARKLYKIAPLKIFNLTT